MKTIKCNKETDLVIKNSKFITNVFRINKEEEIEKFLNQIKIKYSDANHNCYAYIYENTRKCSDDGEPSGTAGIPMLQVLEKKELSNLLVIVTRYFGGIKLGAPGLVRAYTNSVTNALNNNELIELEKGKNINIIFNYDNIKQIDYILKDKNILNKEFSDNIKYNLNIDIETLETLKKLNNIVIEINNEIYIEK